MFMVKAHICHGSYVHNNYGYGDTLEEAFDAAASLSSYSDGLLVENFGSHAERRAELRANTLAKLAEYATASEFGWVDFTRVV